MIFDRGRIENEPLPTAIDIALSMGFRRNPRLQQQRGLLRKYFQKSADSVEDFRNKKAHREQANATGPGEWRRICPIQQRVNLLGME